MFALVFLFLSDEDMQSLASLMSVKPTDIGNLDDFNESDEDEDKKSVSATGRQTYTNTLLLLSDLPSEVFLLTTLSHLPAFSSWHFFCSPLFWLLQSFHTL